MANHRQGEYPPLSIAASRSLCMQVILDHHPRLHHNCGPSEEIVTPVRRLAVDYRKVQHPFTLYGAAVASVFIQLSRELRSFCPRRLQDSKDSHYCANKLCSDSLS